MFTYVRDVFFQSDPFLKEYNNPINFFEEDRIIRNCKINSLWVKLALGEKKFKCKLKIRLEFDKKRLAILHTKKTGKIL